MKEQKKPFKNFTIGMFRQWFAECNQKTFTKDELWEMFNQACPLLPPHDNKTEESWEERFDSVAFDWFYPNSNKEKELVRVIAQKYVDKFKSFIPQIRQEAVQETLEEIEKEIHKIEIDFIWDNGECSFCGYDSLSNEIHTCGRINETIDRVLDIIRDKKK